MHSPENQEKTITRSGSDFTAKDNSGKNVHFTYKNEVLTCTTGISYRLFSLDKSLDQEWDLLVQVFLRQYGIASEAVS